MGETDEVGSVEGEDDDDDDDGVFGRCVIAAWLNGQTAFIIGTVLVEFVSKDLFPLFRSVDVEASW